MFDTSSAKIFNVNGHRLAWILITFSIQIIIAFGLVGFFVETEDTVDEILLMHLLLYYINNCMCLFKIIVFVRKADCIWQLFDVSKMNFIDNRRCRKHVEILRKYRALSVKLTDFFSNYAIIATVGWALSPLVVNFSSANDDSKRFENVFNFRFPVTTFVYNNYYFAFYLMELVVTVYLVYTYVVFDLFVFSFCYTIIAQYEVIALAFENIGYNLPKSTSRQNDNGESINK